MTIRTAVVLLVLFSLSALGQALTPAQIAYLNQVYAKAGENSVPGTWLVDGSVALSKLAVSVLTSESDPIFIASPAYGVTADMVASWNSAYAYGPRVTATEAAVAVLQSTVASIQSSYAWRTNTIIYLDATTNLATNIIIYLGVP